MKLIKRIAFTTFCFFAAIGCYVFGIPAGGILFFIMGIVFEVMFWAGLFGSKPTRKPAKGKTPKRSYKKTSKSH